MMLVTTAPLRGEDDGGAVWRLRVKNCWWKLSDAIFANHLYQQVSSLRKKEIYSKEVHTLNIILIFAVFCARNRYLASVVARRGKEKPKCEKYNDGKSVSDTDDL